ncbi:MAG: ScpA family protein [Pseudomonadota bacterium]
MVDSENISAAAAEEAGQDSASASEEVPSDAADDFDGGARVDVETDLDALIVNIDGYEGPLDVLLDLARHQKVDIRRISMVALVDQYLEFVEEAKKRNLELAADYLVMAAWLAYLKSKLLLPVGDEPGDEPTADEMAARLAFQLQRLEAMRNAVDALQSRPQFGIDFFPRGAPEGVRVKRTAEWQADLYDLLRAYATQRIGKLDRDYHIDPPKVFSIEMARLRLERTLGAIPEWTELRSLVPADDVDAPEASIIASAFNAALEFAKNGRVDLRQLGAFEPIYIKSRSDEGERKAE